MKGSIFLPKAVCPEEALGNAGNGAQPTHSLYEDAMPFPAVLDAQGTLQQGYHEAFHLLHGFLSEEPVGR